MIRVRDKTLSIMVLYCIVLHLFWGTILLLDHSAIGATPIDAMLHVFRSTAILLPILFIAAGAAIAALTLKVPWIIIFLLPQQFLLMVSASGALVAMYLAQYADGVPRPHGFIMADQILIVLAAIGHTIAIIMHARTPL